MLRERRWDQIKSALLLYRNPGSNVEAGLRRRRQATDELAAYPSEILKLSADSKGSIKLLGSEYALSLLCIFMFFPFYMMMCCGSQQTARKTYQEHKLAYLKSVKDSLETQLASVSAAIETIEGQLQQNNASATE